MQRLDHRLHLAYLVSNYTRISRAKTALQNEVRDDAHIGALSLSTTGESSLKGEALHMLGKHQRWTGGTSQPPLALFKPAPPELRFLRQAVI